MCDQRVRDLIRETLSALSPEGQAVPLQGALAAGGDESPPDRYSSDPHGERVVRTMQPSSCSISSSRSPSLRSSTPTPRSSRTLGRRAPQWCPSDGPGGDEQEDERAYDGSGKEDVTEALNASRRSAGRSYVYVSRDLLRVTAESDELRHAKDVRWLRQLLRVAETLVQEQHDHEAHMWLLFRGDDVRRRIRELEAEEHRVVYKVQHEPRAPYKLSLPATMTFAEFRAQPHGSELVRSREEVPHCTTSTPLAASEKSSGTFSPPVDVRSVYPNRSFQASDIASYPHIEMTNTLGLDTKEHIKRTAHQHRCIHCGTAEPMFFRYFSDVDGEFLIPKERHLLHERCVAYERSRDAAVLVANCLEQLYTEGDDALKTQLEKDLQFRRELGDTASGTLSSIHRLRQTGIFTDTPVDTGKKYVPAYRDAHLEPHVHLPPITRGDGHEGHFYL